MIGNRGENFITGILQKTGDKYYLRTGDKTHPLQTFFLIMLFLNVRGEKFHYYFCQEAILFENTWPIAFYDLVPTDRSNPPSHRSFDLIQPSKTIEQAQISKLNQTKIHFSI